MSQFKDQVQAGAKLLEEKFGPSWEDKIYLDNLDIGHACRCVIGQLYSTEDNLGYWRTLGVLFPEGNAIQSSYAHGFSVSGCMSEDIAQLTKEWKQLITERRLAKQS